MSKNDPIIDVWITQYALTAGIRQERAEVCLSTVPDGRMISVLRDGRTNLETYHKPNWHKTKTDAVEHAEQMRTKKIASLKKQIAKLEKLRFD